MSIQITDGSMTSSESPHSARRQDDGHWELSWLPGRVVDRNQATTGMVLAETVASGLVVNDSRWPHLDSWARELGLTGPEAVVRLSTSDEVRAHIARAEAAEAAAAEEAGAAPRRAVADDAVPMTGPVETSAAGEEWSRRVDAAVHGMDATDPDSLDAWMQVHAESSAPHLAEAALVSVWEAREAGADDVDGW